MVERLVAMTDVIIAYLKPMQLTLPRYIHAFFRVYYRARHASPDIDFVLEVWTLPHYAPEVSYSNVCSALSTCIRTGIARVSIGLALEKVGHIG